MELRRVLFRSMVLATLLVLFQVASRSQEKRNEGWFSYLLLGVLAGLGVLSKYNYAIFYAALIAAAISLRSFRPAILNLRFLVALGITLVVVFPNLLWMKTH